MTDNYSPAVGDVTLDLNGFQIAGFLNTSSHGISVAASIQRRNITVRNGTVVQCGGSGVEATQGQASGQVSHTHGLHRQQQRRDRHPGNYKIVRHSHDLDITATTLEFTTTPTRLYRIEFSNNLGIDGAWTDSALATFAPDAGATTTKTITYSGNPKKFFRAVAVMPVP